MKRIICFMGLFILIYLPCVRAQVLIPNPSFEKYSYCPIAVAQIYLANGWKPLKNHGGSADYFNRCHIQSTNASVPNNDFGHQQPAEGEGYVGLVLYSANGFREYITAQLDTPLVAGTEYFFSMRYSLADKSDYNVWGLGVYFSNTEPSAFGGSGVYPVNAQVKLNDWLSTDTSAWTNFAFRYIANGGERYLVIGNFNDNTASFPYRWKVSNYGAISNACYVFLDDVRLNQKNGITGDTIICAGESTVIATQDNVKGWALASDPGHIFATSDTVTLNPKLTTDYLVFSDKDTIKFTIHVSELPFIDLGSNVSICKGDSVVFNLTGLGFDSVSWEGASTDSIFVVRDAGIYRISVYQNLCINRDSIRVIVLPLPLLDLPDSVVLCINEEFTVPHDPSVQSILWEDGGFSFTRTFASKGTYHFLYSDDHCTSDDSVYVSLESLPSSLLPEDTMICPGDKFFLKPIINSGQLLWQDGSVSNSFEVHEPGIYFVTASLKCGMSSDTILVNDCECYFHIPNAFTPDANALNDGFKPEGCIPEFYHLQIFNRWGELIFDTTDPFKYWDGTYKEKLVQEGVYAWTLEYSGSRKAKKATRMIKGTVSVLQ